MNHSTSRRTLSSLIILSLFAASRAIADPKPEEACALPANAVSPVVSCDFGEVCYETILFNDRTLNQVRNFCTNPKAGERTRKFSTGPCLRKNALQSCLISLESGGHYIP